MSVEEKLDRIIELLEALTLQHPSYLTEYQLEGKGVVNITEEIDVDVLHTLGRVAKHGYIHSVDGTILVRINGGARIKLTDDMYLDFDERRLEIEALRIMAETGGDKNFRLLLI